MLLFEAIQCLVLTLSSIVSIEYLTNTFVFYIFIQSKIYSLDVQMQMTTSLIQKYQPVTKNVVQNYGKILQNACPSTNYTSITQLNNETFNPHWITLIVFYFLTHLGHNVVDACPDIRPPSLPFTVHGSLTHTPPPTLSMFMTQTIYD